MAAILLATPINFTSISPPVSPICLPELPLSYMRTFTHHKATVAGWGLPAIDAPGTPEELQKLQINVFTPSECKELYGVRVNRRMMCAGFKDGGSDSCSVSLLFKFTL